LHHLLKVDGHGVFRHCTILVQCCSQKSILSAYDAATVLSGATGGAFPLRTSPEN
jgi:hypothetical protein